MAIGRYLVWLKPDRDTGEDVLLPHEVSKGIAEQLRAAQELANMVAVCSVYMSEAGLVEKEMKKRLLNSLDDFENCGSRFYLLRGELALSSIMPGEPPKLSEPTLREMLTKWLGSFRSKKKEPLSADDKPIQLRVVGCD